MGGQAQVAQRCGGYPFFGAIQGQADGAMGNLI